MLYLHAVALSAVTIVRVGIVPSGRAENMVFPADAGLVNVKTDLNKWFGVGDKSYEGKIGKDITDEVQAAFDKAAETGATTFTSATRTATSTASTSAPASSFGRSPAFAR